VEVIADRPAPSIGCPFTPSTRSQHDERQGSVVAETCKVERWRQEGQPTRTATLLFKGIKAIRDNRTRPSAGRPSNLILRAQGLWVARGLNANTQSYPTTDNEAAESSGCGLAPLITSQSIKAISPRSAGNVMLETVFSYRGNSKPVTLVIR
jgi:hypothetical protein